MYLEFVRRFSCGCIHIFDIIFVQQHFISFIIPCFYYTIFLYHVIHEV